ncbi:hypothetical protein CIW48_12245 [Methylobacterium sp. P1-11]|nr:hypothetical protein CIW48_12245 [Methylobacterium sp. P1-11]
MGRLHGLNPGPQRHMSSNFPPNDLPQLSVFASAAKQPTLATFTERSRCISLLRSAREDEAGPI